MKTSEEIESRIRFLLVEELNARVSQAQSRLPVLCVHNYRHTLDVRKTVDGEVNELYNRITGGPRLPVVNTIGLCMLGSQEQGDWGGTICEDPIDAQRCPYFRSKFDKKQVWQGFLDQVSDRDWLRENMPEVYGLFWALDASRMPELPWWKQLWFRLLRIRVEPVQPVEDPTRLLPPP